MCFFFFETIIACVSCHVIIDFFFFFFLKMDDIRKYYFLKYAILAVRHEKCLARKPTPENLNYPSITALFAATSKVVPSSKTFVRTVMNVGPKRSVYEARVEAPKGVTVTVKPAMLAFADGVTKRSFMVTVTADTRNLVLDDSGAMFGSLSWSDGTHVVWSPIVVTQLNPL
jgi:hypothetical protein